MTLIGKGQQRPYSSDAGYRACVSMCSYNARGWEYTGVIPWMLPRIHAKSGYVRALFSNDELL